ncbi:MAG: DUF1552 domain-containing protein [Nannocystaceae bacterium]|nr:DUF1552 domain-containing protein [bacterium]
MRSGRWSRRDFLRASGVFSGAALLSGLMPKLRASAAGPGTRQLFFVGCSQGTDMVTWRPESSDLVTDGLPYQHEPLQDYLQNIAILDGIYSISAVQSDSEGMPPNGGHEGKGALLTGTTVRYAGDLLVYNGPSVDEIIGRRVEQHCLEMGEIPPPMRTLRIGRAKGPMDSDNAPDVPGSNGAWQTFFWQDPLVSAPLLWGPWFAYEALFASFGVGEDELRRLRTKQASVLDALTGELGRVRGELVTEDKDRLDAHLEGIRELENKLDTIIECTPPDIGTSPDHIGTWSNTHMNEVVRATFQVVATAFACGVTNVAGFDVRRQEGRGAELQEDPEYAATYEGVTNMDLHGQAHNMPVSCGANCGSNADATAEDRALARQFYADLWRWTSTRLKENFLDAVPDFVRDNMIVVHASEMSEGGTHSNYNVPVTIFQGDDVGYFETGRAFKWGAFDVFENFRPHDDPGQPSTKLLVSLCHAMGFEDIESVGDPAFASGPLTEAMA